MTPHRLTKYIILSVAVLLTACSTTKRIPADELLYIGTAKTIYNIAPDTPDSLRLPADTRSEIAEAVDVAPNNYWSLLHWRYPFPLGLWVYNNWSNPPKGFKHWLYEKFVEEPVLVSDVRPEVRTEMIQQILHNNGYFRGRASYAILPSKNPRKVKIQYTVNPGNPYPLRSIELPPDTTAIGNIVDSLAHLDPYLKVGSRYSTDSLAVVRTRIANAMRNRGYYFFRPEFIEYLADSINHPGQIDLRLALASNLPRVVTQPYRTGRVTVNVARNNGRYRSIDTIALPRCTVYKQMPARLRNSVIEDNVTFREGRIFRVRDMDRTQQYLSRMGIFSAVSIEAVPDTTAAVPTLDVVINTTLDRPLEASIEVNASSKSNSYIGPGITLGMTNRNIFGGGEQLSVELTGAYEWQTGKNGGHGGIFNSYEAGLTTSLAFPRLLAPRFVPRRRRELSWTRFALNADLLNRPHYFRMAQLNASMNYDWMLTRHANATLTLFKLTYTKLMNTTAEFDSIMAANPAVAQSFMSQYIPQIAFTYNYSKPLGRDNVISWTFSAQEAGNLFWAAYEACGKHGEKRLFGTPFSQFVKGRTQLVWNHRTGSGDSWLVLRGAVGAAHAYGNSSQVPYAEQFYCGGANSVRAFTVRSIGPGSYRAPAGQPSVDNFDRTGTFLFEANIEWRFPIVGILHGAVFVDSGNVWLLRRDADRPGGTLRARTFLRDLALGTGAGLRLDFGMIIVRGDLGIGIHCPYDTGRRGYYNMTSFGNSLAFHLAIGYPF